jgi:hypothetical protein
MHLRYINISKAAEQASLEYFTAKSFRACVGALEAEYAEKGLPPLMLEEKVARKEGSGAKLKLINANLDEILVSCTMNKKQRAKL